MQIADCVPLLVADPRSGVVAAAHSGWRGTAAGVAAATVAAMCSAFHVNPADLVAARVAGYDTAVFGLPAKDVFPILFELPERGLIVATTRLSSFVTGRYAPAKDWPVVWERILAALAPKHPHRLAVVPVVRPACPAPA